MSHNGSAAERLQAALTTAGISQAEVARRIAKIRGAPNADSIRRQVVDWYNGKTVPNDESAAQLAEALGTPADWFTTTPEARPATTQRSLQEIDARFDALEERLEGVERLLRDALRIAQDDPTDR